MSLKGDLQDAWVDVWMVSIRAAYKLSYHERMRELKGKRNNTFDDRGLHPYSELWGRVTLAESDLTVCDLLAQRYLPSLSPYGLRQLAQADAYKQFIDDTRRSVTA